MLLYPEMLVTKKIFTQAAAKKINITEFFKQSLRIKTTLTAFFFVEKQRAVSFVV